MGFEDPDEPRTGFHKWAAIVATLILVGLVVAVVIYTLSEPSPDEVVQEMLEAAIDGDCERARELGSDYVVEQIGCTGEPLPATIDSVETEETDRSRASVVAVVTQQDETGARISVQYTFGLGGGSGAWKVGSVIRREET